jgi:hypothetical protein
MEKKQTALSANVLLAITLYTLSVELVKTFASAEARTCDKMKANQANAT